MPVRHSTRIREGTIFFPDLDNLKPKIKIIIISHSGTSYTVMDTTTGSANSNFTLGANITRPVTTRLGSFDITIANDNGRFLNVFTGAETVKIYADYTDATNLIFYGSIDNVKYGLTMSQGFFIFMEGRDYPELVDKSITGIEAGSTGEIALAGILDTFFSSIKLQYWNGSAWAIATYNSATDSVTWDLTVSDFPTDQLNFGYQNQKGFSIITEICERLGLDCYVEYVEASSQWYLRVFKENSIINENESVSYGTNLSEMNEYGTDNTNIINRVTIYGKRESDNILVLKTENDTSSQSEFWIKDKSMDDTNLTTMEEVQEKADFELSKGILKFNEGRFTVVGRPTLKPGDTIPISVPYTPITGNYKVQTFTHVITKTFTTGIEVSKELKTLKDIFIGKINPDFATGNSNLNDMSDSYTVFFDEIPSKMTLVGCSESAGKLRLNSGQTTGEAVSNIIPTESNVTRCEFRRYENFSTQDDSYEVTNDGATYETYSTVSGGVHEFTTEGKQLGFKMTLNRTSSTATSPTYESVSLLYGYN